MRGSVWPLVVLVFFSACDSSRVFEDNRNLEEHFWHKDSLVSFDFAIDNAGLPYNLYLNIRNASAYPFYNLYYQYTLSDSSENTLKSELAEIYLFDPKTGKPYGDGLGDLFDHQQPILENYRFPSPGTYTLTFQQFMRRDSLPYILSVGTRVEVTQ